MSLSRFLVSREALSSTRAVLIGPELHHLRVRRLRVGSALVLADGLGHQRRGIVAALNRHQAVIQMTDEPLIHRESKLRLVLAQALLKADKLDLVIEKATELGATELLLFTCARSLGQVTSERRARWNRVARSAAQQCQRSTVPLIAGPVSFAGLLAQHPDALRLFFWEESPAGGLVAARWNDPKARSVVAVVGPEGGFSATEAEAAAAAGFRFVGLAPRILRAETAAVVAVTLCQFLWGDLAGASHEP